MSLGRGRGIREHRRSNVNLLVMLQEGVQIRQKDATTDKVVAEGFLGFGADNLEVLGCGHVFGVGKSCGGAPTKNSEIVHSLVLL